MKISGLLLGLVVLTSNAGEMVPREMMCDETKVIVKSLRETHREIPVISGNVDDEAGSILTIWTNPANDSWTILATSKDYSCIIGTGQKFRVIQYGKKTNT